MVCENHISAIMHKFNLHYPNFSINCRCWRYAMIPGKVKTFHQVKVSQIKLSFIIVTIQTCPKYPKYIPIQRGHHYNDASTTNALKPYSTLFHCKFSSSPKCRPPWSSGQVGILHIDAFDQIWPIDLCDVFPLLLFDFSRANVVASCYQSCWW